MNYSKAGIASVSSRCHNGPPCLTSKCRLMLRVLWFMGQSSKHSGSVVSGQPRRNPSLLLTKNTMSQQVEFLCDNMSAVANLSSVTSREGDLIILLRYLALLAVRHSFSQSVVKLIQLQMLFLAPSFSASGSWPQWPSGNRHQSRRVSLQLCKSLD